MKLSYEELLEEKNYTPIEIKSSFLILHPKVLHRYWLTKDKVQFIFEEWSNFTQLQNPIVDEFGNEYWDSEWYYMAQRIGDLEIKKLISFCSAWKGLSKRAAYLHYEDISQDFIVRIESMRNAIKEKFDRNQNLRELLLSTNWRQIIEYTYWGDEFFGIDSNSKKGSNILWKLLMEYRDKI